MKNQLKLCLECSAPIRGRADKKFCDDQCRSVYHHKSLGAGNNEVRRINYQLLRNRKVLSGFLVNGKRTRVPLEKLVEAGFNFRYFTHQSQSAAGEVITICYDYGYQKFPDNSCVLMRWNKFEPNR